MSGTRKLHRGGERPPAAASSRRGGAVSAQSIAAFMQSSAKSADVTAPVRPERTASIVQLRPAAADPPAEPIATPTPPPRVAIVALTGENFETTVALAVALALAAAESSGLPGAIVTLPTGRVGLAAARRRSAIALSGFDPIGRAGPVVLLGADDAEAASIATAGLVPIVCVLEAGDRLARELARICPSSLLLVAGADVSDNYVELLAGDLVGPASGPVPRVLRFGRGADADGEPGLVVDPAAGWRLRLGLVPGRRSSANAEAAAAVLARR